MKIISLLFAIVFTLATLVLSFTTTTIKAATTWTRNVSCVARPNQDPAALLGAMNWACGTGGVDCAPIRPGGSHFLPNTTEAHASWVFNTYYMNSGAAGQNQIGTCDFGGVAKLSCPSVDTKSSEGPIVGVNIGGYLVLESWIVPSLFQQFTNVSRDVAAEDEYGFNKFLGSEEALKQLTKHWETFYTESDFINIKKAGFTHLRVPFGSWIFGDQPPFTPAQKYLDKLVSYAEKYDLKVLLDLHGAVFTNSSGDVIIHGQNFFDNSGLESDDPSRSCYNPTCPKTRNWMTDSTSALSLNLTLSVISRISLRYKDSPAIWGIELINEPLKIDGDLLTNYYQEGYKVVRSIVGDTWKVVIHDGFEPLDFWAGKFTPAQGYTNMILDTHIYEAFGGNGNIPRANHLIEACGYSRNVDFLQCNVMPTIVGENSLADTDCAKWLDFFEQPSHSTRCGQRPPNTPPDGAFLKEYGMRQMSAWYRTEGFFFWTWKTERNGDAVVWDAQYATQQGWLPNFQNGWSKEVINHCNFSSV